MKAGALSACSRYSAQLQASIMNLREAALDLPEDFMLAVASVRAG
jgi:hypothetical protein